MGGLIFLSQTLHEGVGDLATFSSLSGPVCVYVFVCRWVSVLLLVLVLVKDRMKVKNGKKEQSTAATAADASSAQQQTAFVRNDFFAHTHNTSYRYKGTHKPQHSTETSTFSQCRTLAFDLQLSFPSFLPFF